jgi:hypothetical protein
MPEQDRERPPALVAALVAAWRGGLPIDEVRSLERDLEYWKV